MEEVGKEQRMGPGKREERKSQMRRKESRGADEPVNELNEKSSVMRLVN